MKNRSSVALLTTLSEPYLNLTETLRDILVRRGVSAKVVLLETLTVGVTERPDYVLVASNSPEAWAAALDLTFLGSELLNGEPRVATLTRRSWKVCLTAAKIATPDWLCAENPASIMAGWDPEMFPAYLKHGGHGRGAVRSFRSLGDLSEHFQVGTVVRPPFLIERSLGLDVPTKCYVIGEPAEMFMLKGAKLQADTQLAEMAGEIARATGLTYFSFDILYDGAGQPSVIDVNKFAVFANRLDCWERLARDIERRIRRNALRS